jgi:arabinoxylan arabinofuranohydrolase
LKKFQWRSQIISVLLFAMAQVNAQKLVTPGYLFNSDPTCREINNSFYLFTTQDPVSVVFERLNEFYKGMYAYHAFTTNDFDHWEDHGSILTARDIAWNRGDALWDGDAGVPGNHEFYAYAPFRVNSLDEKNYGTYNIGVFTSANPFGPYKSAFAGPMKMADGKPLEGLSPSVVQGDDGNSYLVWGSGDTAKHDVMIARLSADMKSLSEPLQRLVVPEKDSCGNLEYFESPVLFKAVGKWYLTYVAYKDERGPSCNAKGSYVNYTVADSMFGPFDGQVRHLVYPAGDGEESVQQGVCAYHGRMYLAYHVPYENVAGESDHHRQVAVTELHISADGPLEPIFPGKDSGVGTPGITHLTLDAFAPRREAAEFQVRVNAEDEPGLKGEYQMKLGDGGYLGFRDVDFGQGAKSIRIEVSSENSHLRNGQLEVRLDNPAGPCIGIVRIEPTGGQTEYKVLTVATAPSAKGIHDLFLVARGSANTAQRRLFNVTWFSFE